MSKTVTHMELEVRGGEIVTHCGLIVNPRMKVAPYGEPTESDCINCTKSYSQAEKYRKQQIKNLYYRPNFLNQAQKDICQKLMEQLDISYADIKRDQREIEPSKARSVKILHKELFRRSELFCIEFQSSIFDLSISSIRKRINNK